MNVSANFDEGSLMKCLAVISNDGLYRYALMREWGPSNGRAVTFVMLNPSIADASIDDPTIRRCMYFARREGATALAVVNLFAYRATDPRRLRGVDDPIGPGNDACLANYFSRAASGADPVIAAWGVHGALRGRDRAVYEMAAAHGVLLQCLGRTAAGAPRHPLYLPNTAPLTEWTP